MTEPQLAAAAGSVYGLPCWTPDGSKIATIRHRQRAR
jgi:hypothetical protein